MALGLKPLPTRAMPELPTLGGHYPTVSSKPSMPALQNADYFNPVAAAAPRPSMPALPSMQSAIATTTHPSWSGNLPSIPFDSALSPAAEKLFEPVFAIPLPPSAVMQETTHVTVTSYDSPTTFVAPVAPEVIPSELTQQIFSTSPTQPTARNIAPPTDPVFFPQPASAPATTPLVPFHQPFSTTPQPISSEEPLRSLPPLEREETRLDYTDNELLDSFRPLVEQAVHRSLFFPDGGMDTYIEPMLRATIRRALAEHSPTQAPFHEPGFLATIPWRLRALFTSRTYEEIFFENTKRFRVEEVYLLDKDHLSMISYASCDPMRHASAKRVHGTARRVADGAVDKEGTIRLFYDLPEGRSGVVREGKNSLLVSVVLGTPNDGLRIDLDYTHRRIEERFAARFKDYDAPLLLSIQPHLEDCLLIVAPSSNM